MITFKIIKSFCNIAVHRVQPVITADDFIAHARRAVEEVSNSKDKGKGKQQRYSKRDMDTIKAALGMQGTFKTGDHCAKRAKVMAQSKAPPLTVSRKVLIFDYWLNSALKFHKLEKRGGSKQFVPMTGRDFETAQ